MTAETQPRLPQRGTDEIKNKGSGQKISNDVRIALIVVGALGAVLVVVGATTFALNAINNNYALAMIMTGTAFVSFGVGAIIALVRDHLNKKKKSVLEQPEKSEHTQSTPVENQEALEKLTQDLNTLKQGELTDVINGKKNKDKKILQLEASNLTIKLQAYEDQQNELRQKLRQAVINGNIDSTREILDTASTKEALLALLVSPKGRMLPAAVTYLDKHTNQQEIIKLILSYAAKFDALTNVLYISNTDSPNTKYLELGVVHTAAFVCVLQFLEAHPGPLKQLLEWEQSCNKRSLFQLAVMQDSFNTEDSDNLEDSKKNRDGVTAAILHAADTVDMCMSIVTDAKHGISALCQDGIELEPWVIRCIMEAVKTPENQLAVIKLTRDEDRVSYFRTGPSIAETLKYELYCSIRMKTNIKFIFEEEEDYCNEFAENGVLEKALSIAKECANEQAAELLESFLRIRRAKLGVKISE